MATSISPVAPLSSIARSSQNHPQTLFSSTGSYGGNWVQCSMCSISAAANYASRRVSSFRIYGVKPLMFRRSLPQKKIYRAGFVRCATIEEIESEKSMIEEDVKQRMERTIETVRSNFNSIRTGRANPAMLDKVEVEYYGTPVSLKSIAQISSPDASSLMVQPYDKSSLKVIEKAIVSSDLGLTPNNDGEVIRLTIPQLTSERRKELSKLVAKQVEEGKVAIRNIRRDALKAYEKLEKEKKLSEDNVKDLSRDLQKLTDDYMKKIDSVYKQKEKELLTV
ncbi:hypothetical protein SAY86_003078 [Trapa natans]|uniref:Ribosome-recycling factor, chloroplastic n=1 Tax=Trapa natans TaxID=22666 RepID=A0AAN7LL96_TRANT|nr:hypothetical protein SAY86_003078 [Trapa natans]